MRLKFRQGLVSAEVDANQTPSYLVLNSQGITIRTTNRPTVFTVAGESKNYTVAFYTDVVAWPVASLPGSGPAWLYVDVDRVTANHSFGLTLVEPSYGPTAPPSPQDNQHWFDTTLRIMKVFMATTGRWMPRLRVFAGRYSAGTVQTMAIGTQVGLNGLNVVSGTIVSDAFGKPLIDSSGTFITTEDVVLTDGATTHAFKVESNVDVSIANENIPQFHVIRYNVDGTVALADYEDTGDKIVGIAVTDAVRYEPIHVVLSGKVHNPMWDWGGANVTLWVDQSGELVTADPYAEGTRAKRRVPVARSIDGQTIIFDQGLGGVGERGASGGSAASVELANATTIGIAKLSVDPENFQEPIAVGINDPILTGPRTPLDHTHEATEVNVSAFGDFDGGNAQEAFVALDTKINDLELTPLSYTLNDAQPSLVAAFNALTVDQRTILPISTVLVEYQGKVYQWIGGAGVVTATAPSQFAQTGFTIVPDPTLIITIAKTLAVN